MAEDTKIDIEAMFTSKTEKTFQYDDQLPSLPVPTLQHTLERYLDSGCFSLHTSQVIK